MHITKIAYIEGCIDDDFTTDLGRHDIDYTYKEMQDDKEVIVEISEGVLDSLFKIEAISRQEYILLEYDNVGEILFY